MTPQDYGEWTRVFPTRGGAKSWYWLKGHHRKDTTATVHYYRDGVHILNPKWWTGRYIIKGNFQ